MARCYRWDVAATCRLRAVDRKFAVKCWTDAFDPKRNVLRSRADRPSRTIAARVEQLVISGPTSSAGQRMPRANSLTLLLALAAALHPLVTSAQEQSCLGI